MAKFTNDMVKYGHTQMHPTKDLGFGGLSSAFFKIIGLLLLRSLLKLI